MADKEFYANYEKVKLRLQNEIKNWEQLNEQLEKKEKDS